MLDKKLWAQKVIYLEVAHKIGENFKHDHHSLKYQKVQATEIKLKGKFHIHNSHGRETRVRRLGGEWVGLEISPEE